MSDLVEKISREVSPHTWSEIDLFSSKPPGTELHIAARSMKRSALHEAEKFVRTVLAHFAEAGNVSDGMVTEGHRAFVHTYSDSATKKDWRYCIASAMAAALKEMEG